MELCETRLENKHVREKKERKRAAEYFCAKLAHLLNLVQVNDAKDLPPVWEALVRDSKHQQLLVESQDDMTTGVHPFVLGQHTATVRKFFCRQADLYVMVASSAGAPSLADVEILLAPDGVTLPCNFSMARGQWLRTWLIVRTCFGVDHNASEGLREFCEEMSAGEIDLEEYIPRDAALLPQIPALLLRHAQIRWFNWLASQWGKTSEVPFPDLAGLWMAMENQEPWEPTFPAR